MKILIDNKIPYIKGCFEKYAEVVYKNGADISNKDVVDADALLIRTRTKCNRALLENSSVRVIATATIGFDHIDRDFCREAGIQWFNAPGCNSGSVYQYISAALLTYAKKHKLILKNKVLGIVGVGNVGKKIQKLGNILGMKVLLNDPPRARKEGQRDFVDLDYLLSEADIISLHVPLNTSGPDKTLNLVNDDFLSKLKKGALLINSCRGEVNNSKVVLEAIQKARIEYIADCWENEPEIDRDLMDKSLIATPHIAGYSRDGKANGTRISVHNMAKSLGLPLESWEPAGLEDPISDIIEIDGSGKSSQDILQEAVAQTYNISGDDAALRMNPEEFEKLRGNYPARREFFNYRLKLDACCSETMHALESLGFNLVS